MNLSKQVSNDSKQTTTSKQPVLSKDSNKNNNKSYKSSDYFGYNNYSYFDIENEMVKYRLPQPSALPKLEFTYSKLPPKK